MSDAHQSFKDQRPKDCDWQIWFGYGMLYDGGLCVNRSPEEHAKSLQHPLIRLEYFAEDYKRKLRPLSEYSKRN